LVKGIETFTDQDQEKVLNNIKNTNGVTIEDIGKSLMMNDDEVKAVMKDLVARHRVEKQGRYYKFLQ
jgi:predicted ArsR family transcriptional regulator